jgi:hypothetical protein
VELLIPCILHLENRVGEKVITIILWKALDDYHGINTEDLFNNINNTIRTKVLGTPESPSQWKLPTSKEDNVVNIDKIQVRNNIARCFIKNINIIIDDAWEQQTFDKQQQLKDALSKYREALKILTQHSEYTNDDIELFQSLVDDFYEVWISIFGDEGVTNYIHLLSSGHIMYFMKRYGCLYLYSQQGWEALNNTIQSFIYQNSQHRGHNSGQGQTVNPIFTH